MAEAGTQIEHWSEKAGAMWVAMQDQLDAVVGPPGLAAIEAAAPRPAERVLDIGCGCGESTLELARHVRPRGHVVGVDLSPEMLARAGERAADADLTDTITWMLADAATVRPEGGPFGLVFSRFGIMFFEPAEPAFAHLWSLLRSGGRFCAVAWAERAANGWAMAVRPAFETVLGPLPDPVPNAPGAFGFADPERPRTSLSGAGFADITIERWEGLLPIGGTYGDLDSAVTFSVRAGPTAAMLRDRTDAEKAQVREAVRAILADHLHDGRVMLPGAAWIITARKP